MNGNPETSPFQYEPPGLSVRATFLATDGTRPQEVIVEWRHDPGRAVLEFTLNLIADLADPGHVITSVAQPVVPTEDPPAPGPGESTLRLPRQYCDAQGPGHDAAGHGCTLFTDHVPVEPDGRQHRCRCGGIFAADDEIPDIPGRAAQERALNRRGDR